MRPAACADRFISLVTLFNRPAGNATLPLPFRKPLLEQRKHPFFPFEIADIGGTIVFSDPLSVLIVSVGLHPPDTVETLLKHIVRARHKVIILPHAEPSASVTPDAADRDGRSMCWAVGVWTDQP